MTHATHGPVVTWIAGILVLLLALMGSGCMQTQSTPAPESSEPSGPTSSNAVSQVGERTDEEGVRMPMNRSVYRLTMEEDPMPVSARSSRAYVEEAVAARSGADDATIDVRVDSILALMTLEEKVGQMTQFELGMVTNKDTFPQPIDSEKLRTIIAEEKVGSILNVVDTAFPLEHWEAIVSAIQDEAAATRLGIPVLYGIDAMHGANYTQEAILYPQAQGMAATWNLDLVRELSHRTARDVRASGIPWNFAPVLDTGRDPRWPRFYETFGEDVHLTTAMGLATIHGLQGSDVNAPDRVASTLKHFIGYSGSESGRDRTPAMIPEVELREKYLPPFRAAVKAGAASVMVNSGEVNGVPVHASRYLLTDVLREELGFDGVIVTDWLDIKKLVSLHSVAADEREATRMAIEAGIDLSMVPSDLSFIRHLTALVEDGEIPESRIDASVRRILRLKMNLGLFENPLQGVDAADEVGTEDDRRLALQVARESVTLLRNEDDLLPLQSDQRVLVTGPTAHSMQSLNNGWTYTWQGGGRAQDLFHDGRPTLFEAIRDRVGEDRVTYVPGATLTTPDRLNEAVEAARASDVAVVALGEGAYTETAGNIRSLMLPDAQLQLLEAIANTGTPVVLTLIQGRPRTLGDAHTSAPAILTAYNPGTEGGQALADVLFGDANPSGHLPFTYPDRPTGYAAYDHKPSERLAGDFGMSGAEPLFAFGSGLSYTTFEYSDLSLSAPMMTTAALQSEEEVTVDVTIQNTGERRGKDVVQLYVRDVVASVTPADRRLRRFAKVDLAPGESTTLSFTLTPEDFSFIGRDGELVVEPGEFRILIDALDAEFQLTGSAFTPESRLLSQRAVVR